MIINKSNKKNTFVIALILLMTIMLSVPTMVVAESEPEYINVSFNGDTTVNIEYDGTGKRIILDDIDPSEDSLSVGPDYNGDITTNNDGKYTFDIKPDCKSWTLTTVSGDEITRLLQINITQKKITVRPADVSGEANGQSIKATSIHIENGVLVSGHKFDYKNMTFSGSLNKAGNAESTITNIKIIDDNNTDVTPNYDITTKSGKLVLTEPFKVDIDPEDQGILGGGNTAKPPRKTAVSSDTAYADTSGTGNAATSGTGNVAATDTDVMEIGDGPVPLSSGNTNTINGGSTLENEANNILGLAVFLAAFMIIAIIVIYLVARHRNKNKETVYY